MKKIEIEFWIYIFMLVGLFVGTCTILYANSINIEKEKIHKTTRTKQYRASRRKRSICK